MQIKIKLFTSTVSFFIATSTLFVAFNSSANPANDERNIYRNNNRTQQNRGRYNNQIQQGEKRYDNYRSHGYPDRIRGSMPNDFRRVVYHNQTYYTRDNYYYTYESSSRSFMNVRLPFFSIQF